MPVVMLLAVIAVLVAVFFASTGRGGELSRERGDYAPLDLGPVSPADVALLRPPTAVWGYNVQVTDEALERIALAMRDRDVTISYLQQRLAGLVPDTATDVPTTPRPTTPRPAPSLPSLQAHSDDPGAGQGPPGQQAPAAEPDPANPTDPQDPAGPEGG